MCELSIFNCVFEGCGDGRLSYNRIKAVRPVFPCGNNKILHAVLQKFLSLTKITKMGKIGEFINLKFLTNRKIRRIPSSGARTYNDLRFTHGPRGAGDVSN